MDQELILYKSSLPKPKLLILDEVTSSLDLETESIIINIINTFKGKKL